MGSDGSSLQVRARRGGGAPDSERGGAGGQDGAHERHRGWGPQRREPGAPVAPRRGEINLGPDSCFSHFLLIPITGHWHTSEHLSRDAVKPQQAGVRSHWDSKSQRQDPRC